MFEIRSQRFVGEAKLCSPSISRGTDPEREVEKWVKKACHDAKILRRVAGYRPVGIVFVAPCLAVTQKERCEEQVKALLRGIESLKGLARAWTFPAGARRYVYKNYIYPGVFLALKPMT